MNGFIQLLKKEIHRFMSMWIQTIFGPMSTAILYELIFGYQFSQVSTLTHVSYGEFLMPGLIMMQVLMNAFGNSSSTLIQSKYTGNLIFILMSPITPGAMYSAYLIASILRGIVVGFAVYVGILWFNPVLPQAPLILLYFLILGASITGGMGLIAGIVSEKFDQLAGFQSFILTPLIYLAGVFFNPANLHGIWGKIALFDPFLYAVDGFRYGLIHHDTANIAFGAVFILVVSIVVNVIGYLLLKRGIKTRF